MEYILKDQEPKAVLHYFEEIAAIPHGSGNTKAISDYLVGFAKEHGLRYIQDEVNNVVIWKDAAAGYEDAPALMLQGHMDMVCEKTAETAIDMEKEPIRLHLDGEWLEAEGTTLGGDDGIAIAMMLAILADDTLQHPALECVMTVDEETGLTGAYGLDTSVLKARRLLNLDSEAEGVMTAGCAGGGHVGCSLPVNFKEKHGIPMHISIQGLLGGHSGEMIGLGRANANLLMGRVLYSLLQEGEYRLAALDGGTKDNAITRECAADLVFPEETKRGPIEKKLRELEEIIRNEYQFTDENITISYTWEEARKCQVVGKKTTRRIARLLMTLPQGVLEMSPVFDKLPQTSLNLGSLHLEEEDLEIGFLTRSSIDTQKEMLVQRLQAIMEEFGGEAVVESNYCAWQYEKESPFRDRCVEVYRELTGKEPQVVMIHGGLECGIFSGAMPGLEAVSMGPDLKDIHTPDERLNLPSTQRLWAYVKKLMESLKD